MARSHAEWNFQRDKASKNMVCRSNVKWRAELPGPAGATPVVWDDNIFLTSTSGTELVLLCFGTDGKQRWSRLVGQGNKDARGDEGNSAKPVTNHGRRPCLGVHWNGEACLLHRGRRFGVGS